jgi:hypothetical protein
LADEALIAEPGEKYAYRNSAFEVLGDVIAKVSGQPVVLTNSNTAAVACVTEAALDILTGQQPRAIKPPITVPVGATLAAEGPEAAIAQYRPPERTARSLRCRPFALSGCRLGRNRGASGRGGNAALAALDHAPARCRRGV